MRTKVTIVFESHGHQTFGSVLACESMLMIA